jgi:hypothetical protein
MPDEYPTSIRVVSEQPPVPVSPAVNLSSPNGHATFSHGCTATNVRSANANLKARVGVA